MSHDILTVYLERIAELKKGGHSAEQAQSLLETCRDTANNLPVRLPKWLTDATIKHFDDIEEMFSMLPQIVRQWYNENKAPVSAFAPDAALTRMGTQVLEEGLIREDYIAHLIYAKSDGTLSQEETSSVCAILLCPGRFHSLQLAAISNQSTAATIMALDPDKTEDLAASVRKNDIKQLEFLLARWEIETEPTLKQKRLGELLDQFKAMAGGEHTL